MNKNEREFMEAARAIPVAARPYVLGAFAIIAKQSQEIERLKDQIRELKRRARRTQ